MSNQTFSKLSRDERWEARKRAMFSNDNSLEVHNDYPPGHLSASDGPGPSMFDQAKSGNMPSGNFSIPIQNNPNNPGVQNYQNIANMQVYNPITNSPSPIPSIDSKRLLQQQEHPRGRTPPSNNFFMNPVSEAEQKRSKMIEDYKSYALNDSGRKKEEVFRDENVNQRRNFVDQHQVEDEKRRIYNVELKRQIEEKEANKRMVKIQDRPEEYFPFGKPGAGAPFRDQTGKIIAARPPRFNENDQNFNRKTQITSNQNYYQPGPAPSYPPQYSNNPNNGYPGSYQNLPQASPLPTNPSYPINPNNAQYQPVFPNPRGNPEADSYQLPPNPVQYEEKLFEPRTELEKLGEAHKKTELQRALQEQIEEKRRQKEEEKRRKLLEERYEEERLARERQQMEEEFRREAEKKKKQIDDLNTFNSGNVLTAAQKKPRRPRTPIDLPPAETVQNKSVVEDLKHRGQSALTRSSVPNNSSPTHPASYQNVSSNDIPQEYISFLNNQLDRKLNEFKSEYKVQELRQQEEILRLRQREQAHSEQSTEAQREIERLKDELRRKQLEDDIRHRELTMALQARPNPMPVTKLPPYEPKPVRLVNGIEDASLSLDFAQRSLVSESKFIPLPNPTELFPTKPMSPKEKKALGLDSIFPSLPDNSSNYETFRSGSSSIGVDNLLKKNEDRLKALDKINPESKDELTKLDEILFKFAEVKEKSDSPTRISNNRVQSEMKKSQSGLSGYDGDSLYNNFSPTKYERKIETPSIYSKGDFLPSIKELDGEATYSLPEANKGLYGLY